MFKLRGWNTTDITKRPGVVGKWTTDIVYKRLGPGVLKRLQEIVPRDKNGRLMFKLHQGLTRDKGYLKLKEHLASVTTTGRVARLQSSRKDLDPDGACCRGRRRATCGRFA